MVSELKLICEKLGAHNYYMSASLKASKSGLDKIQQARKEVGWNVDDQRWLIQASQIVAPEQDWPSDNCYYAYGCSETSWKRFLRGIAVGSAAFKAFCQVLELNWEEIVDRNLSTKSYDNLAPKKQLINNQYQDWGDAPDVPVFFGRETELAILKQWILNDRCRLVAITGMGGIGKTDLSLKLSHFLEAEFEYVIWRSLLNAAELIEITTELIRFLTKKNNIEIPNNVDQQISFLLQYLKSHRCLLILDNMETILAAGNSTGKYQPGYEEYGKFLEKIATVCHQSCLILTSREKISKIARLEGIHKPVRFLELKGLHCTEAKEIFQEIGNFSASNQQWQELIEFYNGHPLALELTAHHIQDIFTGDISEFLQERKPIFTELRELLDWHFERLSDQEKEIVYWLTIHRSPVSLADLKDNIDLLIDKERVSENLRLIQSKLPLEKSDKGKYFSLPPLIIEYLTDKFITEFGEKPKTNQLNRSHQTIPHGSKDKIIKFSDAKTISKKNCTL
jgi:hypothetical protein